MAADTFAEMMSNSTLPLGFLHSINRPPLNGVAVGLYFDILWQRELGWILYSSSRNEIYQFNNISANLHFVVRMDDEFGLPISIDKAFTVIV